MASKWRRSLGAGGGELWCGCKMYVHPLDEVIEGAVCGWRWRRSISRTRFASDTEREVACSFSFPTGLWRVRGLETAGHVPTWRCLESVETDIETETETDTNADRKGEIIRDDKTRQKWSRKGADNSWLGPVGRLPSRPIREAGRRLCCVVIEYVLSVHEPSATKASH
ncbi:unnamed protein product [Protopolystoma xenopodis]|uniref:Uncharacterized protein n=1 Tax=Protopolystoma xenopodis TaxID=117903 RepID=A0A3S5FD03_9PLAT|nr:unnamed protein product [Protopolystoma xenopodis]